MERVLAIDPGEKRFGLAVSDEMGWTAQGLPTLDREGLRRDLDRLASIVNDLAVTRIVVGVPYDRHGGLGPAGDRVMTLIDQIAARCGLPVEPWDERLTTKQAERVLIEGGVSRAKRKLSRDRLAAVLILQSYLDARTAAPAGERDGHS
ncbi:MAG TPA: Holliday junction resolvase RuvX [Nitrospiria bacterium]|nr:Holliday junction resolvase RuvX [Nitrospiria bacterium]